MSEAFSDKKIQTTPAEFLAVLSKATSFEALLPVLHTLPSVAEMTKNDVRIWVEALKTLQVAQAPTLKQPIMDCCGSGGSGLPHFNTSTVVAFILAACGVSVVKFGNRGMRLSTNNQAYQGSFDFLSALGFDQPIPLDSVALMLEKSNLAFISAATIFPALALVHQARRKLQYPTLFNYLGPLLHPFQPAYRLMGVSSVEMTPVLADYLCGRPGLVSAHLVQSRLISGQILDELSPIGTPALIHVEPSRVSDQTALFNQMPAAFYPQQPAGDFSLLSSLGVEDNVRFFKRMLSGDLPKNRPDDLDAYALCCQMVLSNASLGLMTAGIVSDFSIGASQVIKSITSGQLQKTFASYTQAYQEAVRQ